MTCRENASIYSDGSERHVTVEPFTNYFIGRVKQDFNEGSTVLGGMLTSTIRNIKDEHLEFMPDNSITGGIDFQHNWLNRKYFVDFKSFFSRVNGTPEAISSLQLNSRHLFQRPDAGHLTFDEEKTSLDGWGGTASGGKRSGKFRLIGTLDWRSPGVELNDLGYLYQADYISEDIVMIYRVNKPNKILLNYYIDLSQEYLWSYGGEKLNSELQAHGRVQLKNMWRVDLVGRRNFFEIDTRQLRGGPSLRIDGNTSTQFFLQTNTSKDLFMGAGTYFSRNDDKISKSNKYTFHIEYLNPQLID